MCRVATSAVPEEFLPTEGRACTQLSWVSSTISSIKSKLRGLFQAASRAREYPCYPGTKEGKTLYIQTVMISGMSETSLGCIWRAGGVRTKVPYWTSAFAFVCTHIYMDSIHPRCEFDLWTLRLKTRKQLVFGENLQF